MGLCVAPRSRQIYEETDKTSFEFSLLRNRLDADRNRTLAEHWCNITEIAIHPDDTMLAYGTWHGRSCLIPYRETNSITRIKTNGTSIGSRLSSFRLTGDSCFVAERILYSCDESAELGTHSVS